MKYGIREICDVVLKAKATMKVGNKVFYKNEPVLYFDSLKTSSMEGAATSVYAQGGRGNARLMAWEGERTVTFTMEDALISPEGFMILSGAGLVDATKEKPVYQHIMETTDEVTVVDAENLSDIQGKPGLSGAAEGDIVIEISNKPYLPDDQLDNFAYVMITENGEPITEPFIPVHGGELDTQPENKENVYYLLIKKGAVEHYWDEADTPWSDAESRDEDPEEHKKYDATDIAEFKNGIAVLCDYYTPKHTGARQIDITPDKFGGNYYLEASTLWRDTNGVDVPAEFIIPNCKIQSNFTFTMASSGDPSTFTFTMDAFPDYTRFDKTKKVLAAIQQIDVAGSSDIHRHSTAHEEEHDVWFN